MMPESFVITVEVPHQITLLSDQAFFSNLDLLKDNLRQVGIRVKAEAQLSDDRLSPIEVKSIDMVWHQNAYRPAPETSLDVGYGIVHLYRNEASAELELSSKMRVRDRSAVVAVLAVPSYLTSSDFFGYLGETVQNQVSNIRMIRTSSANRYMVLLKFRREIDAMQFRSSFNGRAFNSMDPETAHCIFVTSICFKGSMSNVEDFPKLLDHEHEVASHKFTGPKRPIAPNTAALTELPTCVICLERMDASITGLLTIMCEHTFHCNCITKWVDKQSTCPICRFSVARDMLENPAKSCSICESVKNLWMCLICGNVACGRYESQHAISHFEKCQHSFAMDLDSGRIWDYSSDSYVHRLVQAKLDAKPPVGKENTWDKSTEHDYQGTDFEELLSTQLESQRLFYEEQIKAAADKAAKTALESRHRELELTQSRSESLSLQNQILSMTQNITTHLREADLSRVKAGTFAELSRRLESQYKEEACINSSLMTRIRHIENQKQAAELQITHMSAQIVDLEEQVKDLLTHFSASQEIERMPEAAATELQAGSIMLRKRH